MRTWRWYKIASELAKEMTELGINITDERFEALVNAIQWHEQNVSEVALKLSERQHNRQVRAVIPMSVDAENLMGCKGLIHPTYNDRVLT